MRCGMRRGGCCALSWMLGAPRSLLLEALALPLLLEQALGAAAAADDAVGVGCGHGSLGERAGHLGVDEEDRRLILEQRHVDGGAAVVERVVDAVDVAAVVAGGGQADAPLSSEGEFDAAAVRRRGFVVHDLSLFEISAGAQARRLLVRSFSTA